MKAKFWLAVLAYVIPTFPLGYFWHLSTFKAQYDALAVYRVDVIIPMGLASMIIQGLLFAWLYPKLFSTAQDQWTRSAVKFFLLFTILAWSFLVLPVAAKFNMTSVAQFMALETAFTLLQYAVTAPLIALAWRDRVPLASAANPT
ncbi:hypothetical protein OLZ32_11225 [Rhizobium sp. 1AS11]|uniref:hypothetical protein n=1 Tax=Rhizobium acaciae TaxID=2989736 RepID=UPI002220C33C|nr:hypothetical protein [Rhizobium acaciae]MCW1409066.1 hypothetical protein [Rhizobium acaciae]MCW1740979.1 hypothetical protein [Rhizobium acaciae]MCW1749252.1 hypothetical protein [Rhizobium acaciae]